MTKHWWSRRTSHEYDDNCHALVRYKPQPDTQSRRSKLLLDAPDRMFATPRRPREWYEIPEAFAELEALEQKWAARKQPLKRKTSALDDYIARMELGTENLIEQWQAEDQRDAKEMEQLQREIDYHRALLKKQEAKAGILKPQRSLCEDDELDEFDEREGMEREYRTELRAPFPECETPHDNTPYARMVDSERLLGALKGRRVLKSHEPDSEHGRYKY